MKTMAEVLAEHQWYDATSDNEDPATGCTGCDDWFGSENALDDGTFAAHQAAALSAAGFGFVADAGAILQATDLIRDLIDPDDCSFDHHGGCQAHGYLSLQPGEMCPQLEAKAWVHNKDAAAVRSEG